MRTEKTREWAFWNHGAGQRNRKWKDGFLTQGEVQWIMDEEDNETLLMNFCPATGGKSPRWLIRQGHYITLGELFVLGGHRRSCWDLYRRTPTAAGNRRVIPLLQDTSRPFVAARVLFLTRK